MYDRDGFVHDDEDEDRDGFVDDKEDEKRDDGSDSCDRSMISGGEE